MPRPSERRLANQLQPITEDYEGPSRAHRKDILQNKKYVEYWHHYNNCPFNMRRYLFKKLGWRWSTVYSDLCHRFPKPFDRYTLDEIWLWAIELKCYEEDGIIWAGASPYRRYRVEGLYVLNNIICWGAPKRFKTRYDYAAQLKEISPYKIAHRDKKVYGYKDTIWYELTLVPIEPMTSDIKDVFTGRFYNKDLYRHYDMYDLRRRLKELYGAEAYCAAKRQINSQTIKRLRLNG
jgi:hypothetical protein